MKKYIFFVSLLLVAGGMQAGVYLWEMWSGADRSCCLFVLGNDICNPYVPCTRHVQTDLLGIHGYIERLLLVEKGNAFSYITLLQNAKKYIAQILMQPFINLYYRLDVQREVKFFHEIQESVKAGDKAPKASASADKQKAEEAVLAYLIKLGLARPL